MSIKEVYAYINEILLMNMKRTILSGVAVLLILLAVAMPAIGEVTYLMNSNKFSAGEFNVTVDLDGIAGNISINLIDWPDNITPMGFEKFSYNLSTGVTAVSENNSAWKKNVGMPNADGFGDFLSNKVKADCSGYCHPRVESYGYGIAGPLVFTLNQSFDVANLKPNDQGSSLAAHLIFKLNEGNCTFCTWISDGVTKCHHTLGHVVNAGADQMIDKGDLLKINLAFKDGFIKGSHSDGGDSGGCSGEEGGDCMGGGSGGMGGEGGMGGGETGGCPTGEHPDGACPGGSHGGSGGPKGIPHGQCEKHDHTVSIDWGDGSGIETIQNPVNPLEIEHPYDQIGTYTVNVTVTDEYAREGTDSMLVTVISIDTPIDPVLINTEISASALFPDGFDLSNAIWDWGDDTTSTGTVDGNNASGGHTYSTPGIYTITLQVNYSETGGSCEDPEGGCPDGSDGGSGGSGSNGGFGMAISADYVVVYDPDGGFVTGGGWIDSPLGAYTADIDLAGRAIFGFVSKYNNGASIPTGTTEFEFKVADLNFHSSDYEWLVIAGPTAKYKGTGTIKGAGNYGFMLSATDSSINGGGDSDAFRIKIWDKDAFDSIIYDNKPLAGDDTNAATSISGGSIMIHK